MLLSLCLNRSLCRNFHITNRRAVCRVFPRQCHKKAEKGNDFGASFENVKDKFMRNSEMSKFIGNVNANFSAMIGKMGSIKRWAVSSGIYHGGNVDTLRLIQKESANAVLVMMAVILFYYMLHLKNRFPEHPKAIIISSDDF